MIKFLLEILAAMFIIFVLIVTYALNDSKYDENDDEYWRDKTK